FRASIRGNVLELPDPAGGLTPDDLFVVSVASDLAWLARGFLRDRDLADDVSVGASWRMPGNVSPLTELSLTIAVSVARQTAADALLAELEERVAPRSHGGTLRVALVAGGL
ncbi:MAG TPA: hypothetical protein VFX21_01040, partial [Acidimicrobiia bacterium]|nr:hypothetical protein [Acidimicrobiia bacterium]